MSSILCVGLGLRLTLGFRLWVRGLCLFQGGGDAVLGSGDVTGLGFGYGGEGVVGAEVWMLARGSLHPKMIQWFKSSACCGMGSLRFCVLRCYGLGVCRLLVVGH